MMSEEARAYAFVVTIMYEKAEESRRTEAEDALTEMEWDLLTISKTLADFILAPDGV